jgi:hypothetical protein
VFVPTIALGELFYGAQKSGHVMQNVQAVEALATAAAVLSCGPETARRYGELKARVVPGIRIQIDPAHQPDGILGEELPPIPIVPTRVRLGLAEQSPVHFCSLQQEMGSYFTQDGSESANPEASVVGNGEMVLALLVGGEAEVAPGFPSDLVPEDGEALSKVPPRQVAWELHAAMTSSCTKCNRSSLGIAGGSK